MNVKLKKHNEQTYKKVDRKLKNSNIAAVVHPMLSGLDEVGVKFLEETVGKTVCVENSSMYAGMKSRILNLIKNNTLTQEDAKRYSQIEYITYPKLIKMVEEGKNIEGYENILLVDLQYCRELEWQKGINILLEKNPDAKTLELVEFTTMDRDINNITLGNVKNNVVSFISEENGTKMGICSPLCLNETSYTESELRKCVERINKLDNKNLQEELRKKVSQARNLNKEMEKIFPKPERELEDIWEDFVKEEEEEHFLSDEEFEKQIQFELQILELRNKIRKLLQEIKEGLGDRQEESELEILKEEYEGLQRKEIEAKSLLEQVENVKIRDEKTLEEGR